jgi:hypothetical protein
VPNVDPPPTDDAPAEFVESRDFRTLNGLRAHGGAIAAVSALGIFCAVLATSRRSSAGTLFRATAIAGLVGIGVKNLSELNAIIAEMLLPQ